MPWSNARMGRPAKKAVKKKARRIRIALQTFRTMCFLAARGSLWSTSSWPPKMYCKAVADCACVLNRGECRAILAQLDERPPWCTALAEKARAALAARLAELGPEPLPRKRKPLVYGEIEDAPARRSGRVSVNPRPKVGGWDY